MESKKPTTTLAARAEENSLAPEAGFNELKITSNATKIEEVEKGYFPSYAESIMESLKFPVEIKKEYIDLLKAFLSGTAPTFGYVAAFIGEDGKATMYTISGENGQDTANFSERTFTFLLDEGTDKTTPERILGQIYDTLKADGAVNLTNIYAKIGAELNKILAERRAKKQPTTEPESH